MVAGQGELLFCMLALADQMTNGSGDILRTRYENIVGK
jgi:hypothetical protein